MIWLKANWYYVVGAILVLLLGYSCEQLGMQKARADQGFELLQAAQDTIKARDLTLAETDSMLGVSHARVDTIRLVSVKYVAIADTAKHTADSLVVVAHLGGEDTVPACRTIQLALDARTTECAELRKAVVLKDSAIAIGQTAILNTRDSLKDVRTSLKASLDRLKLVEKERTCKVLFVIPCLSRTTSFLVGAGAGITGVLVLHH